MTTSTIASGGKAPKLLIASVIIMTIPSPESRFTASIVSPSVGFFADKPNIPAIQEANKIKPAIIIKRTIGTGNLLPSRSEEHTSELQSRFDLVCRLLLEKKKT